MKKNYIKMNDGNYLSVGNIIEVIKKVANNKIATQSEIFLTLFGLNDINITTINNYCIGYRPIPIELKKKYIDLKDKYITDENVYVDIILSILNILENKVYIKNEESLKIINTDNKLNLVIEELFKVCKNDTNIKKNYIKRFSGSSNYITFINLLNYAVLENIQPIYKQDINIKINKSELFDYLKVKLYFGQSYINSLIELSKNDNMYACAELGSLEFDGLVSGVKDYVKSYEYYLKAAKKNHPKACFMVANLILKNKIEFNFDTMWKYLNKSIELDSAAGYNTLGLCYLRGINPDKEIDIEKAIKYFTISSEYGYVYAFNNLGKIYENNNDIEEAIKYYKISADMGESWALNRVGEYYRKNNDYKTAFMYYQNAINAPINEICLYAYYNLAKYYYENGNNCVNIKRDSKKANEYYKLSGIKE